MNFILRSFRNCLLHRYKFVLEEVNNFSVANYQVTVYLQIFINRSHFYIYQINFTSIIFNFTSII